MVETRISLRGSQSDKILGSDLNLFVTTYFWRGAPLIADDYWRATMNTSLRWDLIALFHWLKTDFGRKTEVQVWPGIGGSHEDQAVNGVLYLLRDGIASQFLDELPVDEVTLARLKVILGRWERHAEALIALRTQPAPIEVPVPEVPPAKPETPPVQVPEEPYGWWDCERCSETNNPPKSQKCMKCHAPRPQVKPDAPEVAIKDPKVWKKTAAKIAALLAAGGFAIKLFLPSWGDAIFDALLALLQAIGG